MDVGVGRAGGGRLSPVRGGRLPSPGGGGGSGFWHALLVKSCIGPALGGLVSKSKIFDFAGGPSHLLPYFFLFEIPQRGS